MIKRMHNLDKRVTITFIYGRNTWIDQTIGHKIKLAREYNFVEVESIAEFIDGLPSHDERNFSNLISKNLRNKASPVYITTRDKPSEQIIVNDNSHLSLQYLHKLLDKKNRCKKRKLVETSEESVSTSRIRP